MACYAVQLLVPAEGFFQKFFMLFCPILGQFLCSVVTLVTLRSNLKCNIYWKEKKIEEEKIFNINWIKQSHQINNRNTSTGEHKSFLFLNFTKCPKCWDLKPGTKKNLCFFCLCFLMDHFIWKMFQQTWHIQPNLYEYSCEKDSWGMAKSKV